VGRILLVRHGQASLLDDDYDRLSPLGERQAAAVGSWLAARIPVPAQVVAGTLQRQQRTAVLCAASAGWPAETLATDAGFDEYGHHELFAACFPHLASREALAAHLRAHPQPRHEFQAMFERAFQAWVQDDRRPPGGFGWADFRARCVQALQRVAASCGSGQVAVVATSGGVIAALCQALLGLPDREVMKLHVPIHNASITTLLSRGTTVSLGSYNSTAHLEAVAGDASLISYR
jgi:broad specificity phosphatase PhoE